MGFKEFWSGVKRKAPGIIGRGLMGAAAGIAPAIDSVLAPYTAGIPVVSTITNAGIGYLQRNAREGAMDRQNQKNSFWNQARGQGLVGEQAKAFVKQNLGKKSFGAKMLKGAAAQKMIKLPLGQDETSNGHAPVGYGYSISRPLGYSISPSSNKPSINSLYATRPRRKKLG